MSAGGTTKVSPVTADKMAHSEARGFSAGEKAGISIDSNVLLENNK